MDKKDLKEVACKICGRCCHMEIPLTLLGIHRIAHFKEAPAHLGPPGGDVGRLFQDLHCNRAQRALRGAQAQKGGALRLFSPNAPSVVERVKSFHCRFTLCPMRVRTPEMMDAFYLGSGNVEEQFRHQAVTRDYVSRCGARYLKRDMELSLAKIDKLTADASELKRFCKQISRFRYVDDTLLILEK